MKTVSRSEDIRLSFEAGEVPELDTMGGPATVHELTISYHIGVVLIDSDPGPHVQVRIHASRPLPEPHTEKLACGHEAHRTTQWVDRSARKLEEMPDWVRQEVFRHASQWWLNARSDKL